MISNFLTHAVRKREKPPACDPQRHRLYKLEREFIGVSVNHVVNRANLQVLADHVCRYYKLPPIRITVVRSAEKTLGWCISWSIDGGDPFDFRIYMNRDFHGASGCVLMHELAHYITDSTYKNHEMHGKEYAGVYMHLLDKYRIMPSQCFRLLAKKHRVQIARRFTPAGIRD